MTQPIAGDQSAVEPPAETQTRQFAWFRRRAVITPLLVLLAVWVLVVADAGRTDGGPGGAGLASDFAIFYSASHLLTAGGNPFDPGQLYHAYTSVLRPYHVTVSANRGWVRVGNPPLFFWALEPLAKLPFPAAAWLWLAAMALVTTLGGLAAMKAAGWTRRVVPMLVFLAMPQVIGGYFTGNVSPVVFLALALGLLSNRSYPLVAGLCFSLAWLKPSVALPLVLLVVLFHSADWKRTVLGFGTATIAGALLTVAALGPGSLLRWIHGLSKFNAAIASQPEMAPLSGLYALWAPPDLRTSLQFVCLAVAAGLTAWWWWGHRGMALTMLDTGWLWFAWFLATPYAHINDVIMLTPPVLALLGTNAQRVTWAPAAAVLYLLFVGILTLPPGIPITAEPLELLTAGACLAVAARRPGYGERAGDHARQTAGPAADLTGSSRKPA